MTRLLPALDLSPAQTGLLSEGFMALLRALGRSERFDIRPLGEFSRPVAEGCCRVAIRCDMAGEPGWTLALARMAARHATPVTVLVNAREAYFDRDGWLTELLVAGPEIGLKIIPWLGAEDRDDAAAGIARSLARLRAHHASVRVAAFDPPCWGVAAEGHEVLEGFGINGRRVLDLGDGAVLPLQTASPGALGLSQATLFGQPRHVTETELAAYFAGASGLSYASPALWRLYYGSSAPWEWEGVTFFTLAADGTWTRHLAGSDDPPHAHANLADAVDWVAATGAGRRFLFHLDPRLLAAD